MRPVFFGPFCECVFSGILVGGVLALAGCSGAPIAPIAPVAAVAPSISMDTAGQAVYELQAATFRVTAGGTLPVHFQGKKNGGDIAGATLPVYTIPRTTMADSGAKFGVTITNGAGSISSSDAALTVNSGIDVVTFHNDNMRSGGNLHESTLTTSLVNHATFGKLFTILVDGKVDAQPLYLSNVSVNQVRRNVLYVATEHGSVYAFDADTGATLWHVSTLLPGEDPSDDHLCLNLTPEIGVTATPVIDRFAGPHGAIYLVGMSEDASGKYHQRLHALDASTGLEEFGGPREVQASFPGTGANSSGGNVIYDPGQYVERSAMLLLNGDVYMTWS